MNETIMIMKMMNAAMTLMLTKQFFLITNNHLIKGDRSLNA